MATNSIHRQICITDESYKEALEASRNQENISNRYDLDSVKTATNEELKQIALNLFEE